MNIDDLYERDFYVWTQEQAAALRAAGQAGGKSNAVDWERLAEEVEDLGNNQYFACRSLAAQIVAHFFKLAWSQRDEPRAGWVAEIDVFRSDLEGQLTRSLHNRLQADLDRVHLMGAKQAVASFVKHKPDATRDESLRWTLAEILGEADPA